MSKDIADHIENMSKAEFDYWESECEQFLVEHVLPSRLFEVAANLSQFVESEQKHVDACERCKKHFQEFRDVLAQRTAKEESHR